jgi:carbonic anhydrase
MIAYKKLFENNCGWIEGKTGTDVNFFSKLAEEQNSEYLYIGCNSRVTAKDIIGLGPGAVFAHRNVAKHC